MIKKIVKNIPNCITLSNLICGTLSIIFAFRPFVVVGALSGWQWSILFIALAAVADFLDGAAARLLHAGSEIGAELDSLADVVSFGVAPALLMFNVLETVDAGWVSYAMLFIPAMGALRLAKFNVDTTQTTSFRGLPIPANAIFWIGLASAMCQGAAVRSNVVVLAIVVMGLLMVSNIRMFSLKFKNFNLRENFLRYLIAAATIAFVVIFGLTGLMYTIILYVVLSLLTAVVKVEYK